MKPLTPKEVEGYLSRSGYAYHHSTGSHRIWKNAQTGHSVPVPSHGNRPMKQGTLLSIFRACGITPPKR